MFFGKPLTISFKPTLNGLPIEWVKEWKYLGVVLKSGHRFSCSVSDRVKSFYRSLNSILRVEGRSDDMVLLRLSEAHCLPLITYAIEISYIADGDEKCSLRVAYNSVNCWVIGILRVFLTYSTFLGIQPGKSWLQDVKTTFCIRLVLLMTIVY